MQYSPHSPAAELLLRFQGRLSERDVVHISRYEGLLVFRRSIRWFAGIVLTLMVAAFVAWVLWWDDGLGSLMAVAWIVVVWLYLLFLLPWERRLAVVRNYRAQEANYLETQVCLSRDRVTIENEVNQSSMDWQTVGLMAVTPDGLLFCNHAYQAFFWLPERLFEGSDLREQVVDLVVYKGVAIRYLS